MRQTVAEETFRAIPAYSISHDGDFLSSRLIDKLVRKSGTLEMNVEWTAKIPTITVNRITDQTYSLKARTRSGPGVAVVVDLSPSAS